MLRRVTERGEPWDFVIIGGGATGMGIAVDAASRGFATLLLEAHDFGKGTSSRSTKLIHGGVRYLQQGHLPLVLDSLRERERLRANAPHLVSDLEFIVPSYAWWHGSFYGAGLALYQILAGRSSFGRVRLLSRGETMRRLPNAKPKGLRGGVLYHDGQFDDARLLIALAATAADHQALLVNYARVTQLHPNAAGRLKAVSFKEMESGEEIRVGTRAVINAAGPFVDEVRHLSDPEAPRLLAPSQGAHIVLDPSFLGGATALMVPRTMDGRVMFAIPWHGRTLIGTTDTAIDNASLDPQPLDREIEFLLETAGECLARKPNRGDILSVFAGIRPLVKSGATRETAALSRDHTIALDARGLITITGGKWTTYRRMAEDCVDRASVLVGLPARPCHTATLRIHGFTQDFASSGSLRAYGSDAPHLWELIAQDSSLGIPLDPALPNLAAEVIWAARHEMARTVEDVLARRTRALFLDARAALRMAPGVAGLLARELGRDDHWHEEQLRSFATMAAGYLPRS